MRKLVLAVAIVAELAVGLLYVAASGRSAPPTFALACVAPPAGMVSWWPGDGNANDIIDAKSGTLQGGATFAAGMVGQAFSLLGTTDYVRIDDANDLDILGDLTVDAWINLADVVFGQPNPAGVGGDRVIVDKRDIPKSTVTYVFFIEGDRAPGIGTGSAPLRFFSGSSVVDSSILNWAPNTWYHVAVVKSGVTITFYRDGAVVGTGTIGNALSSLGSSFTIGAIPSGTIVANPLVGLIDEVEVFNRALSAPEIQAIFNAGSAGKCKVQTIAIDIKPGSFPNSINPKSNGVIPVAILTTDTFEAITVDPTTVRFGATGTEAAPAQSALEDIDGDGDTDMIFHFNTQDTGIACGDTVASLTGKTFAGQAIKGSDSIKTVECK